MRQVAELRRKYDDMVTFTVSLGKASNGDCPLPLVLDRYPIVDTAAIR
jgi:hypothetical protein